MFKKKINILSITSKKLNRGDYRTVLPEYYALKSLVENNSWHLKQNVFDHCVAAFKGLEEVFKLKFLEKKDKNRIEKYLKKKVGCWSRKELLIIATILHDIGKMDTLITDSSGSTRCPAHEIIGSILVKKFTKRFGLDKKGQAYVEKIVRYHGFISDILALAIEKGDKDKYYHLYKEVVGDVNIELLLWMYADDLGTDLKKIMPKEFEAREKLIAEFLTFTE